MKTRELELAGSDYVVYDLGELAPSGRGRIVEFSLRLKDILPDRRVAVAVELREQDAQEREFPRGLRTYAVPPHDGPARDVVLRPIRFILPEELDVSRDGLRRLTVRVDAHYIDSGGLCVLPEA